MLSAYLEKLIVTQKQQYHQLLGSMLEGVGDEVVLEVEGEDEAEEENEEEEEDKEEEEEEEEDKECVKRKRGK